MKIEIFHFILCQLYTNVCMFDCSCLGRVQSLFSQLLYVVVGQAEQPLSTLPAGVGRPANWKVKF